VVPEWGRSVFSDLCVMMKPSGEAELASFVRYCHALVQAYLQIARHVQPPASNLCAPLHCASHLHHVPENAMCPLRQKSCLVHVKLRLRIELLFCSQYPTLLDAGGGRVHTAML